MRMGTAIGRVVLSAHDPKYLGGRLVLALPWKAQTFEGGNVYDPSIVVYDVLGADQGQNMAISEGAEASRPFPQPNAVDAYCAALVDEIFYQSEEPQRTAKTE
jgi:microcompartment protein CcmK/EutM